jgi:hypothetical protein
VTKSIGTGKNVTVTEPILVIAFNRPDHLTVLIDRLREVQPTRVYFAVDGPRKNKDGEAEKVALCKDLAHSIDWDCEVITNFQESNLGCGLGVSTAITWFFENEERGIILEDDIIPDPSFYPFCTELLQRYELDPRVFAISGCNFVPPDQISASGAYRFSQVPHIWGWASWRDRWAQYELDISGWRRELPARKLWSKSGNSIPGAVYWAGTFELLARKEVDTWDGQLVYMCMKTGMLTATSNTNLIENIGFNDQATHTIEDRDELQAIIPVSFPTTPVIVKVDHKADSWTRKSHFRATWPGMLDQGDRFLRRRKAASNAKDNT